MFISGIFVVVGVVVGVLCFVCRMWILIFRFPYEHSQFPVPTNNKLYVFIVHCRIFKNWKILFFLFVFIRVSVVYLFLTFSFSLHLFIYFTFMSLNYIWCVAVKTTNNTQLFLAMCSTNTDKYINTQVLYIHGHPFLCSKQHNINWGCFFSLLNAYDRTYVL